MDDIVVFKNRRNVLPVSLGYDISGDTFESQIREKALLSSPLVAEWTVTLLTDGTDGELILTLDDSELSDVTVKTGYMDIKRISGGEPFALFAPVKVKFQDTVTE